MLFGIPEDTKWVIQYEAKSVMYIHAYVVLKKKIPFMKEQFHRNNIIPGNIFVQSNVVTHNGNRP